MPVSVPKEATEAMLRAWYEAQRTPNPFPAGTRWAAWDELPPGHVERMRSCYRAMLAAAPQSEEG